MFTADANHRLQQQEIVQLVKTEYGMEIDRRTVKHNVEMLKDMFFESSYEISTEQGYCLFEREFTDAELRLLIDSVLFSKIVSQKQAKDLIGKLKSLSSKFFNAKVSHVYNLPDLQYADKKQQVLYNLDTINDAISLGNKIHFTYNKYNTHFQLVPKREGYQYVVSPYQKVARNGYYYLICSFDKYPELAHLRIDKMTDVIILDEKAKDKKLIPELKNRFNMPSGSNNSPSSVFSNCAKAFYDICEDGIVGYVPQDYYCPPNISYSFTSGSVHMGYTSYGERADYRWNGFESKGNSIYELNVSNDFMQEFHEGDAYALVLYTSNYGDYEKFQKCVVTEYDFNEELTNPTEVYGGKEE